ncbi:MAG TPA: beta-ketoacyl-[acyl-carrier-protein] synthase family protein [Puia sp.]|nr:beta-ketoacyl-[acyl-carrier-protein] synthase family protein [Puia sp.]
MAGRVFVTGMGVISAIGDSLAANRQALVQKKSGIGYSGPANSRYMGVIPFGGITLSDAQLRERTGVHDAGVSRTTLLAAHAFRQAIEDAELPATQLISADTALIGATTVGGMCLTDELYRDTNGGAQGSDYLASYDGASVQQYLQHRYGFSGLVTTINTACSSSANAIQYGARLIRNGMARRAIVGGVDSLAKFTINGFNALQILSPAACKPFDEHRQGLNLGEGAGFLVLEREADLAGKRAYAELTGYCNVNDAYHASSLSPDGEGPFLAMQGALRSAGLDTSAIGYINAHGTGTENNDASESQAMIRIFGTPPAFASTKSSTGHTLGASGAIEAVYSILSLLYQEAYPSVNFSTPMAETGLRPLTEYKPMRLQHVLSNSFGFGGNCTSLVFSVVPAGLATVI